MPACCLLLAAACLLLAAAAAAGRGSCWVQNDPTATDAKVLQNDESLESASTEILGFIN